MRYSILLLLATAWLTSPGGAQEREQIVSEVGASYQLRPGDVVRITVWGRED